MLGSVNFIACNPVLRNRFGLPIGVALSIIFLFVGCFEGPTGPAGVDGIDGKDGNTIISGKNVPSNTVGEIGDYFIDTVDHYIYGPKKLSGWGDGTLLYENLNIKCLITTGTFESSGLTKWNDSIYTCIINQKPFGNVSKPGLGELYINPSTDTMKFSYFPIQDVLNQLFPEGNMLKAWYTYDYSGNFVQIFFHRDYTIVYTSFFINIKYKFITIQNI